jgi:hypothetical protein
MSVAERLTQDIRAAGGNIVVNGGRLKLSAPAPLPDALIAKLRDNKPAMVEYLSDNLQEASRGRATLECDRRSSIVAWINSNPPNLPESQNNCAACGELIPVYETGWVYLGDGALIHHGGETGDACWKRWQRMRRVLARKVLGVPNEEANQ